ncbi:MAG: hypothetical protein LQ346_007277 [Caloplaca aetnensis]|nr:MAG: hypothetical protein LQ346_007277 [Caloplaca aetnensis]
MPPRTSRNATSAKAKPEACPQQNLPPAKSNNARSFPLTGPVERYVNDEGKVAVMYSPGFGGGWSSYEWCYSDNPKEQEIRAFDKDIVEAVLEEDYKLAASLANLKASGVDKEDNGYLESAARKVQIGWLNPGEEMNIDEYDGNETIIFKQNAVWMRS